MISKQQALQNFEQKVKKITDVDYGDFKRKTNVYLEELQESFQPLSAENKKTISQIRFKLLLDNQQDIDSSTYEILNLSKKLI